MEYIYMGKVMLLICSFYVLTVQCEVTLEADRPSLKVELFNEAVLECCYNTTKELNISWVKISHGANRTESLFLQDPVTEKINLGNRKRCDRLVLKSAKLNDTGLYRCILNKNKLSHGTYLQVYMPLKKTINISESVKNGILMTEGILLLLCVMLPSANLLFKSKNLNNLEKKKADKEEENIYQGLNLDDCCTPYDQIERSQGPGPYQDVCNNVEVIQLEKP